MAENAEKVAGQAPDGMSHLAVRMAEKANKLKYVVLIALIVVLAAVAIFTYQRRQAAAREAAAENSIFQAQVDMINQPEKDATASFASLAKEHAGLPAGARALTFEFSTAYEAGEYAKAESALRELIKRYPNNLMIPRARLALGQTLLAQDKNSEAMTIFRELSSIGDPAVLPEAKLALAQTLERDAETVKGQDPEEYARRLKAAEDEYNDIVVRSSNPIPAQRGYWPEIVTSVAEFSLVAIKDRLAGYEHLPPRGPQTVSSSLSSSEGLGVMNEPPPPPEDTEDVEPSGDEAEQASTPAEEEAGE